MKRSGIILAMFVILSVTLFPFSGSFAGSEEVRKVIIDGDMGWDDTLSILYLLKNPDIEIIGVTVTGCGETNLRWGTIIAKTLMELGGRTQVPVCKGTSTPMRFDYKFPQPFRNDMNDIMGLIGSLNPETEIAVDPRPAWQFLAETLDAAQEKITILSLGGFTNVAKMLQLYPATRIENIEGIYAMAGSVYVDGNVAALNNASPDWDQGPLYSTNHYAEWNIFVDPLAAKMVFDSRIPVTLVSLDACDYVMLNPDYIDTITAKDPIAGLVRGIFVHKTGSHDEGIPVPIFDPLATMIMAGGLDTYQVTSEFLDISLEEDPKDNQCGRILVVKDGSRKIDIVQGVSAYLFQQNFAAILNR